MAGKVRLGVLRRRQLPFFQVGIDEMAVIGEYCPSRHLAYARSVYIELVRCAHEAREAEFELGRTDLARRAGVSPNTLDRVLPALAEAGVVEAEGGRSDGRPKRWILLGAGFPCGGKGVPLVGEGGSPDRGRSPSRVDNDLKERDREGEGAEDGGQGTLDVPEERVERFTSWHAEQVLARRLPLPRRTKTALAAARELLSLASGEELRAMFEFAKGQRFWASKVLTMPEWRKNYPRLRAEWLAAQETASRNGHDRAEPTWTSVRYDGDRVEIR